MKWQKVALRNLCEITSSKRIYVSDYQSDGIPFYRGREISEKFNGNLDVSTELFISESKYLEIKEKFGIPQPGDLLLTSVGTLGNPYVVKEGEVFYFKDGNLTWFRNFKGLDSNYLYYWIVSPQGKAELKKCTIGSSQSAFTIVLLKDIQIALPPIPAQRRIADILSAYDNLIENNSRRIRILEQMAQAIYQLWFGNINPRTLPKGWKYQTLKEVADVVDCLHTKKPNHTENGTGILLQLNNIGENGKLDLTTKFLLNQEDYKLWTSRIEAKEGDCVITNVGRVAAVAQIPTGVNAALGRNMTGVRPRLITPTFLIEFLLSPQMEKEVHSKKDGGVIMDALNVRGIVKLELSVPPSELLQKFEEVARPIRKRIEIMINQNANLRQTRDLLLPRLVSGEVDV